MASFLTVQTTSASAIEEAASRLQLGAFGLEKVSPKEIGKHLTSTEKKMRGLKLEPVGSLAVLRNVRELALKFLAGAEHEHY
ncbi:hypothetical protein P3T76_014243 [Phytophthora citrophthora]|uniref:Uncharacterized protein n=1 Tax=Phytophthora citrophthora TaxID=4793 RepID=A0AAD9G2C2_9STRA|nr:hypothetical protein P3T76_014243 [Phytophthora citrophthora]